MTDTQRCLRNGWVHRQQREAERRSDAQFARADRVVHRLPAQQHYKEGHKRVVCNVTMNGFVPEWVTSQCDK
jgi:hypothetical protein